MMSTSKRMIRVGAASVLSLAMALGTVGLAGADGGRGHGRGFAHHDDSRNGRHEAITGLITTVTTGTPSTTVVSFTLKDKSGTSTTYPVTNVTQYFQGRTLATSAALVVGDMARVMLTNTTPATVAAVSVTVPSFEGHVTAVGITTPPVITITGPRDTSRTVITTGTTTITTRSGTPATLASIVVGSEIRATGTIDSTGTMTATSITVSEPPTSSPAESISGVITAVGPGSFALQGPSGPAVTYTTTSTTQYFFNHAASTASAALVVGDLARIVLTTTTPATVAMVSVTVPSFEGRVTAVATGTSPNLAVLTITGPHGSSRTVNVTNTTTLTSGAGATVPLTSIVVGSEIRATGTIDSTGTMTATSVVVSFEY